MPRRALSPTTKLLAAHPGFEPRTAWFRATCVAVTPMSKVWRLLSTVVILCHIRTQAVRSTLDRIRTCMLQFRGLLHFRCATRVWCGRRDSNPRALLGKQGCCHYITTTGGVSGIRTRTVCLEDRNASPLTPIPRTPRGIRTLTIRCLKPLPLPLGYGRSFSPDAPHAGGLPEPGFHWSQRTP